MNDLNQLLLNFEYKQNFKDEDFYVSNSNYYAFNLIGSWPKWEKNTLKKFKVESYILPDGERFKNTNTLNKIHNFLIKKNLEK